MKSDLRSMAERALETAMSSGADEAEVCAGGSRLSDIKLHAGRPEQVRISDESGVGVRLFCGGRAGFFSTSDPAAVESGVRDVARAVQKADADPCAGLPETPAESFASLDIFDPKLAALGPDEKIRTLAGLEREALDADPRIVSKFFSFRDSSGSFRLMNSRGLDAEYESTSYGVVGAAAIKDERRGTRGFFYRAGRKLEDFSGLGKQAADRALKAFGGRPFPPRTCTVVFDGLMASLLFSEISDAFLGNLVLQEESFLAGRLGEAVASPLLTIVDDLAWPGAPDTLPFDGEGVPARRTVLLEKGVLKSFLFDTYWARRAKTVSTGNALRAGYRTRPGVSQSNFAIEPGSKSLQEIVASVDDGLLVLETVNVGAVDVASGDYSVAATGVRIEKGRLTSPVGGVTVAGRMQDMLRNVVAVGNDFTWHISVASPTLAIEGMTVGG